MTYYASDEKERDRLVGEIKARNPLIQRFKGLGEMNAEQLWETTMNPATRTLLQVSTEDAAVADEVFTRLMGERVAPRREFIRSEARRVRNLDV